MILLIEDSNVQRIKLRQCLHEARYDDICEFSSAEALLAYLAIEENAPLVELILIDHHLPGLSGMETARHLKLDPKFKDIPVIMLTASADPATLEQAFEAGVNDYLSKPVTRIELVARMRSMLKLKQETDARKLRERQLRQNTLKLKQMNAVLSKKEQQLLKLTKDLRKLSETFKLQSQQDGLTGLANRRYFDYTVAGLWAKALQTKTPLSMIVLDIDGFKAYNDSYGHAQGDQCLTKVAQALKDYFTGKKGFVARYGGEEFVICLPTTRPETAYQIANKLRASIENLGIPHENSPCHKVVTASFGTAHLVPQAGESYEKLFQEADSALYLAKERGRNRVEHFGTQILVSQASVSANYSET